MVLWRVVLVGVQLSLPAAAEAPKKARQVRERAAPR